MQPAVPVEPDRAVGRVLAYPMPAVTASGVVGTPSHATAEHGAQLFGELAAALGELLVAARSEHGPKL